MTPRGTLTKRPLYLPIEPLDLPPPQDFSGTDIQQAEAVVRPLSEGAVVVVTRHNEVSVAMLRLPTIEEALGSRMN